MIELNLSEILIGIVIVGFIFIALYKMIEWFYDAHQVKKAVKQAEIKRDIKKLDLELERMKGFPFIKVMDVQIGQFVSNADSVYLCVSDYPYESEFLDLTNKKMVKISWNEVVRKRADLDAIICKEKGESNDN